MTKKKKRGGRQKRKPGISRGHGGRGAGGKRGNECWGGGEITGQKKKQKQKKKEKEKKNVNKKHGGGQVGESVRGEKDQAINLGGGWDWKHGGEKSFPSKKVSVRGNSSRAAKAGKEGEGWIRRGSARSPGGTLEKKRV